MAFLAYMHMALFLALSLSPLYASFLCLMASNSFLFTPALFSLLSTKTHRIFLGPFILKAVDISCFFIVPSTALALLTR